MSFKNTYYENFESVLTPFVLSCYYALGSYKTFQKTLIFLLNSVTRLFSFHLKNLEPKQQSKFKNASKKINLIIIENAYRYKVASPPSRHSISS